MARSLSADDPMTLRVRAAAVRKLSDATSDPFVQGKLLRLEMALLEAAWLSELPDAREDFETRP